MEVKGTLIIWNNKDITIEGKSLYWKTWSERGIYFVQNLLKNIGNYLSYEEFKTKYNMEVNFIYYCQILSAIPRNLKFKAMTTKKPPGTIIQESDVYQLAEGKTILLYKMRCKDYYSLFQVKWETQPTSVQSWSKHYLRWPKRVKHKSVYQNTKQFPKTQINFPKHKSVYQNTNQFTKTQNNFLKHKPVFQNANQFHTYSVIIREPGRDSFPGFSASSMATSNMLSGRSKMFCHNCGSKELQEYFYCSQCGTKLDIAFPSFR